MDPASIAFAALAEEYRRAGRFEEAIAACTSGLLRHPSYLSAHVTLGRSLIEVGRYDDAREELEHVLKLAPENLAAIRGIAEIHHRLGDDLPERYSEAAERQAVGEPEAVPAAVIFAEAHAELVAVAAPPVAADAVVRTPHVTPALAALESFLHAIARTRTSRAAGR